ncbi:MAG: hypothetical protein OXC59_02690, partial [Acidimicrobiaceae bacterium]|nr:hypothetical protein [Acidimicrobiaceae bacterium]
MNADSTSPAAGSSTDDAATANSEDGNGDDPDTASGDGDVGCSCAQHSHRTDAAASASSEDTASGDGGGGTDPDHDGADADSGTGDDAGGGWVADITVLAHVDDTTGELIGELSDGSKLPAAVLEELSCNARWAGLVFDRAGDAIWRSRSRRTVSDTQWQALLATYGGCF